MKKWAQHGIEALDAGISVWTPGLRRLRQRLVLLKLKAEKREKEINRLTICAGCDQKCADAYMVKDEVWMETGLGNRGGVLHLKCLEISIGRELTIDDFVDDVRLNDMVFYLLRKRPDDAD
jgi:hypothetical protein